MFGFGGASNNVNAQIEADQLARLATQNQPGDEDPGDERAEQMTNAARALVGSVIVAAIAVGAAWTVSGTTAAVIVVAVVGLVVIAVLLRRRSKGAGGVE